MYGYIYETTCKIDGKKYIGMHKWSKDSIDPNYLGSGLHLQKAIQKYGKSNFECRILEWCSSREELSEKEEYYISKVQAPINPDYYNIEDGGFGGHSEFYVQPKTDKMLLALEHGRHLPMSDKAKALLSERRTNCIVSSETRSKLRNNQLGRICVTKDNKNKYIWPEQLTEYESDGWVKGSKKHNMTKQSYQFTKSEKEFDEIKQKISNTLKGRRWVTNGVKSLQVDPELVNEYLDNGYRLGRK